MDPSDTYPNGTLASAFLLYLPLPIVFFLVVRVCVSAVAVALNSRLSVTALGIAVQHRPALVPLLAPVSKAVIDLPVCDDGAALDYAVEVCVLFAMFCL